VNSHYEKEGLYAKYRVFYEPVNVDEHPVPIVDGPVYRDLGGDDEDMDEVQSFVFVLKPDTDHHALVALAAYAASVKYDDPELSRDLMQIIEELLTPGRVLFIPEKGRTIIIQNNVVEEPT